MNHHQQQQQQQQQGDVNKTQNANQAMRAGMQYFFGWPRFGDARYRNHWLTSLAFGCIFAAWVALVMWPREAEFAYVIVWLALGLFIPCGTLYASINLVFWPHFQLRYKLLLVGIVAAMFAFFWAVPALAKTNLPLSQRNKVNRYVGVMILLSAVADWLPKRAKHLVQSLLALISLISVVLWFVKPEALVAIDDAFAYAYCCCSNLVTRYFHPDYTLNFC